MIDTVLLSTFSLAIGILFALRQNRRYRRETMAARFEIANKFAAIQMHETARMIVCYTIGDYRGMEWQVEMMRRDFEQMNQETEMKWRIRELEKVANNLNLPYDTRRQARAYRDQLAKS